MRWPSHWSVKICTLGGPATVTHSDFNPSFCDIAITLGFFFSYYGSFNTLWKWWGTFLERVIQKLALYTFSFAGLYREERELGHHFQKRAIDETNLLYMTKINTKKYNTLLHIFSYYISSSNGNTVHLEIAVEPKTLEVGLDMWDWALRNRSQ